MRILAIHFVALALCACAPPGSVTGTLNGEPFKVVDGVWDQLDDKFGQFVTAVLGAQSIVCGGVGGADDGGNLNAGGDFLDVSVHGTGLTTYNVGPIVSARRGWNATVRHFRPNVAPVAASSGTVTVTAYAAQSTFTGTFTAHFDDGSNITGSFNPPFCSENMPANPDAGDGG